MKGVKNKINDIEANVTNHIHREQAKLHKPIKFNTSANLHSSPRKNFNTLFNSMNQGRRHMEISTLDDEIIKNGKDGKNMGVMEHRGANYDVQSHKTPMGNANNV
jgi:hypothetical protein